MVLHKTDVCNYHVKNVFTDCLDITAQLQFLPVQQHHANLPLHVLRLATLLVGRDQDEILASSLEKRVREHVLVSILTMIEEGTDRATQGSLAIFTNSGP